MTVNPQVLAFGQEPSRKTVPGNTVGEEPDFLNGSLESDGCTREFHYDVSAKSVQIMKEECFFVQDGVLSV